MCLMLSNATADQGLIILRKSGQRRDFEGRLAKMAAEDSRESAAGLHKRLAYQDAWYGEPELRGARKYRIGNHRFYITGQHTDCQYMLFYVKEFKRSEERREESPEFQRELLRALQGDSTRVLDVPNSIDAADLEEETSSATPSGSYSLVETDPSPNQPEGASWMLVDGAWQRNTYAAPMSYDEALQAREELLELYASDDQYAMRTLRIEEWHAPADG